MDIKGWAHREVWQIFGRNISVEVVRYDFQSPDWAKSWCVYVDIRPGHPRFTALKRQGITSFERDHGHLFHGGITFEDLNSARCRLGADYSHAGDERFYKTRTPEEAAEVFHDAGVLFDALNREDGK